jgi:parallel beta-helix repeat protein
VISGNDITNGKAQMLCMLLGSFNHNGNHVAERTLIANNRIHDCGAGDNHQHGMYLENTQGVRIVGNEFVDNADRAIQLYPSAQGTVIEGNVLDGNGEGIIFSGLDGVPSNNNVVRNNVLTGARIRSVVESYYPEGTPRGTGNLVENNCVHSSTSRKPIDLAGGGFVARNNLEVDPQYVDVAARDLRLRPGSPCAAILEAGRAGINLPVQTAAPTAPTAPASQPAPALTETIANPAPSPLTLSAVHEGTELRVKVRLAPNAKIAKKPVARLARVEYRASKRAPWRLVGVGRVARNRSFTAKRRVFAAAGTRIQVRAMVIRSGRPSAIAFSAVKRAPQL